MTAAEVERQLVVFSLHGEHYGLPITSVREIIRYVPPRATATATGMIRGMISLRERTLPIVDLSGRLGQRLEVGSKTRILVVEVSGGALGLVVDTVDGILPIPSEQIERLPGAAADSGLGEEVAAVGDRLIVLIDAERRSAKCSRSGRRRPGGAGRAPRGRAHRRDRNPLRSRPELRRSTAGRRAPPRWG